MHRTISISARSILFCLVLFIVLQGQSLLGQGGGGQGGGPPTVGDITAVNTPAGGGLTGGATSGDANLRLLTTCSSGQVLQWNGSAWACATPSGGTGTVTSITEGLGINLTPDTITSTGSVAINTSVVPQLGSANTFAATQTISSGNLALPNTTSASSGVLTLNGNPFLHGYPDFTNAFVGTGAGNFAMTGQFNTALGTNALNFNSTGGANTALGYKTLISNTEGSDNTAVGLQALFNNKTGLGNTAVGRSALEMNQFGIDGALGNYNTAVGLQALSFNTSGNDNASVGAFALWKNTSGAGNVAMGRNALISNTTGGSNIGIGVLALGDNTSGFSNIALGESALKFNIDGHDNIAIGNGSNPAALHNVGVLYIGNEGAAENHTIRIGANQTKTFIAGISGVNVGAQPAVLVDSNGQLGVNTSSRLFKYDIRDMDEATKSLLRLRPVTFRYKQAQNDGSHPVQYGLIAEEVAEVLPELVAYDESGQPNTVLYHVLPAMLLNEFQKQNRQVEAQQDLIQSLQRQLVALAAQTRELQTELASVKARSERGSEVAVAVQH
ncbi:MAG: tail fiber domain-containing protein [Acidobacteria bacterium]|nr:tail fiber domain-containing protein [Acidobacteriota bacterium]